MHQEICWFVSCAATAPCCTHDRPPVSLPWHAAEHGCANETVALRNVGRDTESFLWFIVQRYDSLAEYTLFTQAAPLAAAVSAPHSSVAVMLLQHELRHLSDSGVHCGQGQVQTYQPRGG